jgi:hypothetical protein
MSEYLLLGSVVGAVLGLTHGISVYRQIAARNSTGIGPGGSLQGLYYALWTFALWTLFGSYVLVFWLLGALGYPIVRLIRGLGTVSRARERSEHAR